jgi:hypothetical protein
MGRQAAPLSWDAHMRASGCGFFVGAKEKLDATEATRRRIDRDTSTESSEREF